LSGPKRIVNGKWTQREAEVLLYICYHQVQSERDIAEGIGRATLTPFSRGEVNYVLSKFRERGLLVGFDYTPTLTAFEESVEIAAGVAGQVVAWKWWPMPEGSTLDENVRRLSMIIADSTERRVRLTSPWNDAGSALQRGGENLRQIENRSRERATSASVRESMTFVKDIQPSIRKTFAAVFLGKPFHPIDGRLHDKLDPNEALSGLYNLALTLIISKRSKTGYGSFEQAMAAATS
jgi:hypothetical protein